MHGGGCAGILPYSIAPADGTRYFYLGQETNVPGFPEGSMRWCEFAGGMERCETVEMGAAREFLEESLGCIAFDEVDACLGQASFQLRQTYIAERLKNKDYTVLVCAPYTANTRRKRYCFVKEVPWQPDAPRQFAHMLNSLRYHQTSFVSFDPRNLHTVPAHVRNHPALVVNSRGSVEVQKCFLEKQCVALRSWNQLASTDLLPIFGRIVEHLARLIQQSYCGAPPGFSRASSAPS